MSYIFNDVTRDSDGFLYMAYYFPQYHIAPENKIQLKTDNVCYTDWDVINKYKGSATPCEQYNLANKDTLNKHDVYAHNHNIGVFIFYHYWLDNTMVLNHPVELFMQSSRKTKFMLCWDNESGFLGHQKYDQPEKHAYQLLRYFQNENYLTDIYGRKPFHIYLSTQIDVTYITRFLKFLSLHDINVIIGHNYQSYHNNYSLPEWSQIACEFGAHSFPHRKNLSKYHIKDLVDWNKQFWQGCITSWDSRPRTMSGRTRQKKCNSRKPNGDTNPNSFKSQLKELKENIHVLNTDKIITIFAFNEWAEGATLEPTIENGERYVNILTNIE
jgi:hypothetical protein